jgi:hypothetical protein
MVFKAPYAIIHYKEKCDLSKWILGHGHRGGRETRGPIGERSGRNEFREKGRFCTILLVNFVLIFKKTIANITNLSKYEEFVVNGFRNSSGYFRNKNLLSALLGSVFVPAVVSGFSYLIIKYIKCREEQREPLPPPGQLLLYRKRGRFQPCFSRKRSSPSTPF